MFKCAEDVCYKDLGTVVIMTSILGQALMPWTSGESSRKEEEPWKVSRRMLLIIAVP